MNEDTMNLEAVEEEAVEERVNETIWFSLSS